jgi:hypothetical protein
MQIGPAQRGKYLKLLGLSETEAFPVKVGVQGVNDKAVQAVVKKKPENVVAVVSW